MPLSSRNLTCCALVLLAVTWIAYADVEGVLFWEWSAAESLPNSLNCIITPAVVDLDGNGRPEIIFVTAEGTAGDDQQSGMLRAIAGDDGSEYFTNTERPVNWSTHPCVGDIDGDGRPEIVTVDADCFNLIAFEHDGSFKWRSDSIEHVVVGGPAIADLDQDGSPEIIIGRQTLSNQGKLLWTGAGGAGRDYPSAALSVPLDIDGNGVLDLLAGNTLYDAAGQIIWRNEAIPDGFTAVADVDGDHKPEIAHVSAGKLRLLSASGDVVWGPITIPGTSGLAGPPAMGDLNGDGQPEILVSASTRLSAFNATGDELWQAAINDSSSSLLGVTTFDLDGDGACEVVGRDQTKLLVLSGADGSELWSTAASSCTLTEYPVVADADGDGQSEIVVAVNNNCGYGNDRGLRVYRSATTRWACARSVWNQHTYHVTNVGVDGTIPRSESAHWLFANGFRINVDCDDKRLRGDMNCDGSVDFNDIDPFVTALISRDDYEAQYPDCNWLNGDIDESGAVDFNDIDGFVECLINGGCP